MNREQQFRFNRLKFDIDDHVESAVISAQEEVDRINSDQYSEYNKQLDLEMLQLAKELKIKFDAVTTPQELLAVAMDEFIWGNEPNMIKQEFSKLIDTSDFPERK